LSFVAVNVTVCADSSAGPALMAVAQPATVCAPESSRALWSAPFVKLGASLTGVTVMVKDCEALVSTPPPAVPPLSCAATLIVALPLALGAAVYVSVPSAATAGPALNSDGFEFPVTLNETVWPDSSAGPALIAVAQPATLCGPPSSSEVWSAPFVKLGASLTAVMLIVNVCSCRHRR
jgi:hypothetical protein